MPNASIGENCLRARKGHYGADIPSIHTLLWQHTTLPALRTLQINYIRINLQDKELLPLWISSKLRVQNLGMAG